METMSRKQQYMTGLSIVALVFTCGCAIPTIIEGINIARNNSRILTYDEHIVAGSFTHYNFPYQDSKRMHIDIRSTEYNESSYDNDRVPIIFSIMLEEDFISWIDAGSPEPGILNSTVYVYQADIDLRNLQINYNRELYLIIYNSALIDVEVFIDIELIPWGHIIATSVTGFPFALFFTIFIVKILSTAYYNGIILNQDKKHANQQTNIENTNSATQIERLNGKFCQSCGAPITPKDGQYCPNCGASV